ncbi:hypothetical protein FPC831_890001 [Flavobacterium psychrophilum]|nr:hypothetical protein FPC831_890001 [Flavobacterium psychrophilum]
MVKYNKNNPTQLILGPGKTGKKLPKRPITTQIKPTISNNLSSINIL